jgi:hypothetical protein
MCAIISVRNLWSRLSEKHLELKSFIGVLMELFLSKNTIKSFLVHVFTLLFFLQFLLNNSLLAQDKEFLLNNPLSSLNYRQNPNNDDDNDESILENETIFSEFGDSDDGYSIDCLEQQKSDRDWLVLFKRKHSIGCKIFTCFDVDNLIFEYLPSEVAFKILISFQKETNQHLSKNLLYQLAKRVYEGKIIRGVERLATIIPAYHTSYANMNQFVTYTSNGRFFLSTGNNPETLVFNSLDGSFVKGLPGRLDLKSVRPDKKAIITAYDQRGSSHFWEWDADTWSKRPALHIWEWSTDDWSQLSDISGFRYDENGPPYSPNNFNVNISASGDRIHVENAIDKNILATIYESSEVGNPNKFVSGKVLLNGKKLMTISTFKDVNAPLDSPFYLSIKLWDLKKNSIILTLCEGLEDKCGEREISLSSNESLALISSVIGKFVFVNLVENYVIGEMPKNDQTGSAAILSPDGSKYATKVYPNGYQTQESKLWKFIYQEDMKKKKELDEFGNVFEFPKK